VIEISACNRINVRFHCFGRTFLYKVYESLVKLKALVHPSPTVNSGYTCGSGSICCSNLFVGNKFTKMLYNESNCL